jgi:hypothetical protein
MFGIALAAIALLTKSPLILSVGAGLVIDQIPWVFGCEYFSKRSVVVAGILLTAYATGFSCL